MIKMDLTESEANLIRQQRQQSDRRRWICEGIFYAAKHLNDLGDQSAGGDGRAINPSTSTPYGQPYYHASEILLKHAMHLVAHPNEITHA